MVSPDTRVTVLAGGVGAARFLAGLVRVVEPAGVTAVVNVADDVDLFGLRVSPDLDTVTYTLAGVVSPETGWGLVDETWQAMATVERLGGPTWFRLGDRDLGTHLYRTRRLAEGAPLSTVTAEIAGGWGAPCRILPVSDDRIETRVTLTDGREIGFQEYFVRERHAVEVAAVRFAGADDARPAPGVLEAIDDADVVVIAPSNPVVSIGPLLAVAGLHERLAAKRQRVVGVSPLIGGRALKGPADRLLRELGERPDAVGVARRYRDLAATAVIDTVDAPLAAEIEALGVRAVVTDTIMRDPETAGALAARTVEAAVASS
ncbi:MAG: 2-phospho-L-lactate transferase [Actinomyces sp.]|nr:MAG: 2-phospho-L-lactate transferase [Actinomyces sp.]